MLKIPLILILLNDEISISTGTIVTISIFVLGLIGTLIGIIYSNLNTKILEHKEEHKEFLNTMNLSLEAHKQETTQKFSKMEEQSREMERDMNERFSEVMEKINITKDTILNSLSKFREEWLKSK